MYQSRPPSTTSVHPPDSHTHSQGLDRRRKGTSSECLLLWISAHPDYRWQVSFINILSASLLPVVILHTHTFYTRLAERYGARYVLGAAVFFWSTFTLLIPLATRHSLGLLIFVRILLGMGEGMSLPAIHALLSW